MNFMIENYKKYLEFLDAKLNKFFKSQKPYIFCKKGCALCCKHSQFPYSLLEMKYLLSGLETLDCSVTDRIEQNLQEILSKKKKFRGKKFLYDCPFLIDNICSLYNYRGVVCRTFGLMTQYKGTKVKAPFCSHKGLNYSNVLNLQKRTISVRKFKKLKVKEEPLGFNVNYSYLTNIAFEQEFNILFGETKPLIDWFIEDKN